MLWESENRAEQCRILQIGTVDAGNGTLFGTRNKRAIQRDHLTLVIGSGGMGAATIHAAVQKARQNLESDFDNYTKFILVDSDWREIARMEKEQVEVLNISTPGASYRLRKENRGDFFKKFVHPDYDVIKLGPNGSARDRVTGKIKFYDNAEGGSTNDVKFRNIIQTIFNTDWSDKTNLRVDVMILAGLSGGNGSGTFEELAVHAREACRRAGATEVRVFGYLFLPDTVEAFERENLEALKSIYINGYSALKELESYMSIPASPGRGEELIKFCLRIRNGNDDEEFYVKTLVNMYESLEEFTSFIEPVPVPEEWVCSYGHHNLENHCFCSVCGEKRGWKCESCGHYHNNKIRFCPECGARAPMK